MCMCVRVGRCVCVGFVCFLDPYVFGWGRSCKGKICLQTLFMKFKNEKKVKNINIKSKWCSWSINAFGLEWKSKNKMEMRVCAWWGWKHLFQKAFKVSYLTKRIEIGTQWMYKWINIKHTVLLNILAFLSSTFASYFWFWVVVPNECHKLHKWYTNWQKEWWRKNIEQIEFKIKWK